MNIKNYPDQGEMKAIDLAKMFFAVCIVLLHCNACKLLPGAIAFLVEKLIFRLAVPFFFIVSGYMLSRRSDLYNMDIRYVVKDYSKRLAKPLLVFALLNGALEAIKLFLKGESINQILIDALKHLVFYPYGAMWYVRASIIGAILLLPFLKSNKVWFPIVIGFVGYCFALLCNNYYFLAIKAGLGELIKGYMEVAISARNGLFVGFFLLSIGVLTYHIDQVFISRFQIKKLVAISYFAYLIEILMIRHLNSVDDGSLYFSSIILVPLLILLLNRMHLNHLSDTNAVIMRKMSTVMYFFHRFILSLVVIIELLFSFEQMVLINTSITLLISCIIAFLMSKRNNSFYRLLFLSNGTKRLGSQTSEASIVAK